MNEEYAGQVVFSYVIGKFSNFYKDTLELKTKSPDLIDIFPNMNIGLLPDEESCAERAVSAPQNIATNMTAADIIFGYVNKLLNKVPIDTLVYFFDSRTMIRKAYSGRKTHVKELLKLVEGNENLPKYINGEKWTGVDIVKAPTYEEVLSSSNEVDDILERASELEEESQDISTEEQEEGTLPQAPEDVFEAISLELNDASRMEGFPSSTLRTVQDIRSSVYFEVSDVPEITITEEEVEGVICSTIYLDDMAVLRNVPHGIDYYENYEHREVQVSIQGNVNDYLTQEGSSLVLETEINSSIETEDVVAAINNSPEGARNSGNLNDVVQFDFMDNSFTRESLGLLIDNNLRIYNDSTEDLSVRGVAINNLISFIDELLELNIIETETIEEFEDSWTNYHETIIDEIIDAHVAQQEFESTELPF